MQSLAQKQPARVEQFVYGPWTITASTSHILASEGVDRDKFESELELPSVPEMIFDKNFLRLQAKENGGFGIEFTALDALKRVDSKHDLVKVACAAEWRESRQDNEHIKESVKPYDWTYSTDYRGTLIGDTTLTVEPTEEQIYMEMLKRREKILFYQDILLFEDELSDNGTSILSVKMRVMPSCLLLLLRQYVRVDEVLVRVNDTRLFQQAGKDYMLREFTCKEGKISELKVPFSTLSDANEVQAHLTTVLHTLEKLSFPATDTSSNHGETSTCPVSQSQHSCHGSQQKEQKTSG